MLNKNIYLGTDIESDDRKLQQRNNSKRKIKIKHFTYEIPRYQNYSSSSVGASSFKNNSYNQLDKQLNRSDDLQNLNLVFFTQKYLPRNAPSQTLESEMQSINTRKEDEINSLLIYRDQLKLINSNKVNSTPIKLSLNTLKQKAKIQSEINNRHLNIERQIKNIDKQAELLNQFLAIIRQKVSEKQYLFGQEILDIGKEEELMLKNLEMETNHLIKQLSEEQRKNDRAIRNLHEEIQYLRVTIKQQQDKLRDHKAKLCTMYIKLHSHSGLGGKNNNRNMSISVKKFNNQNHFAIREVFVGSSQFKNFSKEILEKVVSEQELVRIRFYVYKIILGMQNKDLPSNVSIKTGMESFMINICNKIKTMKPLETNYQSKIRNSNNMKFFFKSKIVGVQCRVKTDKGNRHLQIGNCSPNVQHQLLTLVNKNLVTLGSFWHSRQMIGISVWYSDRMKQLNTSKSSKQLGLSREVDSVRSKKKLKTINNGGTYEQYYA